MCHNCPELTINCRMYKHVPISIPRLLVQQQTILHKHLAHASPYLASRYTHSGLEPSAEVRKLCKTYF